MNVRKRLVAYGITVGCSVLFVLILVLIGFSFAAYGFATAISLMFVFACLLPIGALYLRLRHPIRLYSFLVTLLPRVWLFYVNRGHAYLRLAQYDLALADFERALQLRPGSAIAYNGRATVYMRTGRWREALPNLDQALRWNPRLFVGYVNRAYVYDKLRSYQWALADINQALSLRPRFAMTYLTRVDVYAKLGDYQRALEDIETYRRLAPRSPLAYSNRARLQGLLGNIPQALQDYTTALALPVRFVRVYDPQGQPLDMRAMLLISRSWLYLALRDYQHAFQDAREGVELAPNYAAGYYTRGVVCLGLGKIYEAQADLEQAVRVSPGTCGFRLLRIWVQMCQVKPDLAQTARLEEIAKSDPEQSEARIFQGIALWLRGIDEEALKELEWASALEQNPWERWKASFWTALVCGSMMRDDKSVESLRQALATGMPLVLAEPLRWLEETRPEFYGQRIAPLLAASTSQVV